MKLIGIVKSGQGFGKKTGLKTANLNVNLAIRNKIRPGLYKCHVEHNENNYNGLVYYGYNSLTKQDCLEIHILNFTDDLYNEKIQITIGKYLREPIKFDSIDKFSKKQLHKFRMFWNVDQTH